MEVAGGERGVLVSAAPRWSDLYKKTRDSVSTIVLSSHLYKVTDAPQSASVELAEAGEVRAHDVGDCKRILSDFFFT